MIKLMALMFLLISCDSTRQVGNSGSRTKPKSDDGKTIQEESGTASNQNFGTGEGNLSRDFDDQSSLSDNENDYQSSGTNSGNSNQNPNQFINDQIDDQNNIQNKVVEVENNVDLEVKQELNEIDYSQYPTSKIFQKTKETVYYGKTTRKTGQLSDQYITATFYNEVKLLADDANAIYYGLNIEKLTVRMYYHDKNESQYSGEVFKTFIYDNIPGTVPLFRCFSKDDWDFFNSLSENCEGKGSAGVYLGHIIEDSEIGTPLIRCHSSTKRSYQTVVEGQACPQDYAFEKYLGSYQK